MINLTCDEPKRTCLRICLHICHEYALFNRHNAYTCFLAFFGFEDHVGVLDFLFKRSETGALQIEHSYQFRSTKFELGDAMVSRVFAKWKIDGDEARGGQLKAKKT